MDYRDLRHIIDAKFEESSEAEKSRAPSIVARKVVNISTKLNRQ